MKNPFLANNKKGKRTDTPKYKLSMRFLDALKLQYRREIESGVQLVLKVTRAQLNDWRLRTEVSSSEYCLVYALAKGEEDYFMDIKFDVIDKIVKTGEEIKLDLTK